MRCPKCDGTELTEISMPVKAHDRPGAPDLALDIDQCPECDGIWFDPGELDRFFLAKAHAIMLPKTSPKSVEEIDRARGKCPRCAVELKPVPGAYNPKVTLDACSKCGGTWVDGAEIERAGGDGLPFGEKMKAMFGDLKPGR
jgi:Zn-finger nucleic acid-binding protein